MSLTSYRAAPPRGGVFLRWRWGPCGTRTRRLSFWALAPCSVCFVERDILDWPGNDLLSRVLRHSTISAEEFNGRVRDGIGFWLLAQATGPAKDIGKHKGLLSGPVRASGRLSCFAFGVADIDHENDQADRAISTGKLNPLLGLHTRPINVVVFHGSDREYSFSGWFPA